MVAVAVIIIASIVGGFFLIDSPQITRMKKRDQERVMHLNNIRSIIASDYINVKTLPAGLSAPKFSSNIDPSTNQLYEYRVIDSNKYELCATFELPAEDPSKLGYISGENWDYHQSGRQCFEQTVSGLDAKPLPPEAQIIR